MTSSEARIVALSLQLHVQAAFLGELVVVEEVGSNEVLVIADKLAVVDLLSGVGPVLAVAELDRPVLIEVDGVDVRS